MNGSSEWWATVLDRMSAVILRPPCLDQFVERLPADALQRDTLVQPAATADELMALEIRLGRPFSASYKALLLASNGFAIFGKNVGRLLPAAEVDWFPKRNPAAAQELADFIKAGNPKRPANAKDPKWTLDIPLYALEITEALNGATLLLHPRRGRGGGEWDVWLYQQGTATRFVSLADLIEQELRTLGKRP